MVQRIGWLDICVNEQLTIYTQWSGWWIGKYHPINKHTYFHMWEMENLIKLTMTTTFALIIVYFF